MLNLPAQRVGKIKGEIIAHATPHEVLALGCDMRRMPRNGGKEIIYRRYLPYGATTSAPNGINRWSVDALAHLTQEGVTPTADRLRIRAVGGTIDPAEIGEFVQMARTPRTSAFGAFVPESRAAPRANVHATRAGKSRDYVGTFCPEPSRSCPPVPNLLLRENRKSL